MGVPSMSLEDDLARGLAQHLRRNKKLCDVLCKMRSLAVSLTRSHG